MTDDHIGVRFATLRSLTEELEDILQQTNERLDNLYTRAEKVVLTWEGEARNTFVDTLDRWDLEMQDLQAAQRWLHEIATTGQTNYRAAHMAVLRGWTAQ
ncbi:WXG100 family type VII secretion target [Streptomyces sp. NPDC055886]